MTFFTGSLRQGDEYQCLETHADKLGIDNGLIAFNDAGFLKILNSSLAGRYAEIGLFESSESWIFHSLKERKESLCRIYPWTGLTIKEVDQILAILCRKEVVNVHKMQLPPDKTAY